MRQCQKVGCLYLAVSLLALLDCTRKPSSPTILLPRTIQLCDVFAEVDNINIHRFCIFHANFYICGFLELCWNNFDNLQMSFFLIKNILMIFGAYITWFDTPITPWSIIGTLTIVLIIAMVKEGLEDGERHRADYTTNRQATHCFRWSNAQPSHPILQNVLWNEVAVGDIVKIFNNGNIPADTILLGSLESFGNSYLETLNIDGETNL